MEGVRECSFTTWKAGPDFWHQDQHTLSHTFLCQARDKKQIPASVGCEVSPNHFHAQTGYSMSLNKDKRRKGQQLLTIINLDVLKLRVK